MDDDKLTPKQKSGYTQHQKARQRYELKPRHCAFCYERLPYEKRHNKFCDQHCAASQIEALLVNREHALKFALVAGR